MVGRLSVIYLINATKTNTFNSKSLYTVKRHFYAHEKIIRNCQNEPLDKFMQFLFMCSSTLCIATYGAIKICDLCLTRIIHINLTQKFVALGYTLGNRNTVDWETFTAK